MDMMTDGRDPSSVEQEKESTVSEYRPEMRTLVGWIRRETGSIDHIAAILPLSCRQALTARLANLVATAEEFDRALDFLNDRRLSPMERYSAEERLLQAGTIMNERCDSNWLPTSGKIKREDPVGKVAKLVKKILPRDETPASAEPDQSDTDLAICAVRAKVDSLQRGIVTTAQRKLAEWRKATGTLKFGCQIVSSQRYTSGRELWIDAILGQIRRKETREAIIKYQNNKGALTALNSLMQGRESEQSQTLILETADSDPAVIDFLLYEVLAGRKAFSLKALSRAAASCEPAREFMVKYLTDENILRKDKIAVALDLGRTDLAIYFSIADEVRAQADSSRPAGWLTEVDLEVARHWADPERAAELNDVAWERLLVVMGGHGGDEELQLLNALAQKLGSTPGIVEAKQAIKARASNPVSRFLGWLGL
jgi:hypothetical protein